MRKLPLISAFAAWLCFPLATNADDDLGLYAFPNPFTAGYGDAALSYSLPAAGDVTVKIFNIRGDLIRELLTRAPRSAGPHVGEDRWDGRNDARDLVEPGAYVAVLEARAAGDIRTDTFVIVVER